MNITVYCGAALGNVQAYQQATIELGKWLAKYHHRLIYGGGKAGLMGLLADTVLSHGGEVIGVIPAFKSALSFLFTVLSVSAKYSLLSE